MFARRRIRRAAAFRIRMETTRSAFPYLAPTRINIHKQVMNACPLPLQATSKGAIPLLNATLKGNEENPHTHGKEHICIDSVFLVRWRRGVDEHFEKRLGQIGNDQTMELNGINKNHRPH